MARIPASLPWFAQCWLPGWAISLSCLYWRQEKLRSAKSASGWMDPLPLPGNVMAVMFSIFSGSLLGSLVGLFTLLVGKRVWLAKLPFGPYLAFGTLIWMFYGQAAVQWYLGLLGPR